MNNPKECDPVLLDDGVKAIVLERYVNGDLSLKKEIPSNGVYPGYWQFGFSNSRVVRSTYHANS